MSTIMINGAPVEPDAAGIPLDDGFVRGDGVFEGMRAYGRRIRTLDAHLSRLARSAREIHLPCDTARLGDELRDFCALMPAPECGIRLMLSRGGLRVIRAEPLPQLGPAIRLAPVPHQITPVLAHAKTLSYAANMQAHRRAQAEGADEALLVRDSDGVIYEGPTSSFVWLEGDRVCAPPIATTGVLDSITRRLVDDAVGITEVERTLADLTERASAAMLVSTYFESVPVSEILGVRTFDAAHPRLGAVRQALRGRIDADLAAA